MKTFHVVAAGIVAAALLLPHSVWCGDRDGSRRGGTAQKNTGSVIPAAKCENGTQSPNITIKVTFSGESGRTITNWRGTCYNVFGCSFFEDKVYLPAYWGVFPLYFFGDRVGTTVVVSNESTTRKAKLILKAECYCLNTDGSNGTPLMAPADYETTLAAGETQTIDASFVVDYVPDADSGLDRLLIKAYRAPANDDGEHTVSGGLNINPNNSVDNEFTLTLPDGATITRDNLTAYAGAARSVRVKPKGNGNQNTLIVDGKTYDLVNANTYSISGDPMTVNLYNAKGSDAMGQWWIGIDAGNATVTCTVDGQGDVKTEDAELITSQEAIFCPPEFEGELWQSVVDSLDP